MVLVVFTQPQLLDIMVSKTYIIVPVYMYVRGWHTVYACTYRLSVHQLDLTSISDFYCLPSLSLFCFFSLSLSLFLSPLSLNCHPSRHTSLTHTLSISFTHSQQTIPSSLEIRWHDWHGWSDWHLLHPPSRQWLWDWHVCSLRWPHGPSANQSQRSKLVTRYKGHFQRFLKQAKSCTCI